MMAAMQVKVRQSNCNLADLTENEMFWKHHWSWQSGPRAPPSEWAPETPSGSKDPYVQSLLDRNKNLEAQLNRKGQKGNGGGGGGRQRGAKRNNGGNWDAEGREVPTPPPPPHGSKRERARGKGKGDTSTGRNAFARRGQKGGGK